ncbi:hypothetical protein DIPPA_06294 [Diplonema papillatum]|nr:hypothetical protein DIPPA_06294 [Diplonema papillatum]
MNNLLMRQCADVPMGGLGQYADVATGGFGPRVGGSVCGACCGMTLVLGSMAMIVWNEGHAVAVAQELDVLSREVVSVGSRAEEASVHLLANLVYICASLEGNARKKLPNKEPKGSQVPLTTEPRVERT